MDEKRDESIKVYLDISGDTPRDQAISVLYQDYREGKGIEGLSPEEAACVIAQGFARFLFDHLAELEAEIKSMERAERERKEKYPDKLGI